MGLRNKIKYIFLLLSLVTSLSLYAVDVSQSTAQTAELHSINKSLQDSSQAENSSDGNTSQNGYTNYANFKHMTSGAKHNKLPTPQQINAKGQNALNGTTYKKQQLEREKLKVQSEKYQAEIAKHRPTLNSNLQQQNNESYKSQQSPQQQSLEKTQTTMPAPSFLEQESNQNQAEIKAGEKNQMQFYNANDN